MISYFQTSGNIIIIFMRTILIFLFTFLVNFSVQANHQNEAYEPHNWGKFEIKGSDNYYKFNFELVEDQDVKKEIKKVKNKEPLIKKDIADNKFLFPKKKKTR